MYKATHLRYRKRKKLLYNNYYWDSIQRQYKGNTTYKAHVKQVSVIKLKTSSWYETKLHTNQIIPYINPLADRDVY